MSKVKKSLKHGIAVYQKEPKKLVHFVECETGDKALQVLSGIRRNMSNAYKAEETIIEAKEIEALNQ